VDFKPSFAAFCLLLPHAQASSRGYDRLPQFGAASRHGLARGQQERLLMRLRVLGLLQDDTQRQEQHGSIVSVLSLHQVGEAASEMS
jgi:hypothetical protein